ncbi:class III lanthionine synthetase LanKC [Stigmatella hybrida]|uniref:class III lanthionine synthetase LanKC n=1 Tax=Stigmatella hybrida TaxID=394097 RepID=UPI001CDB2DBE|nr:class III lanthionine synthetase LanKC [Stigmatella hybrida]
MFSDRPDFLYSLLDDDYYESIESYVSSPEYLEQVRPHLDDSWRVQVGGYWTYCRLGPDAPRLAEGWKIHLAASELSDLELLRRTVPLLAREKVAFKFCADRRMLQLSSHKNMPRTGAGKFVAIYPSSQESFVRLLALLDEATQGMKGPFLLTDRPYKASKVVYYRYGEHYGYDVLHPSGRRTAVIRSPEGKWVSDERKGYFKLPPWITDPFSDWKPVERPKQGAGVPLQNRYRVQAAMKFHGAGGIYRGVDTQTGSNIIIREARPVLGGTDEDEEGFRLLQKEGRILSKLGPTGYTANFVALFKEWEHLFLVQEQLSAESLWGYSMGFFHGSTELLPSHLFTRIRDTIRKIIAGLKTVHAHDVVLRDITRNNVMFTASHEVKFIDLEFAYELDRTEAPIENWTPGYTSPEQRENGRPHPADDHYAMGALILDMVSFSAPGLDLNREGILASYRQTLADYELPGELYDITVGLLEPERQRRWDLDRVLKVLETCRVPSSTRPFVILGDAPPSRPAPTAELREEIAKTVEGLKTFILDSADYNRDDRLWPTRPELYWSNPLHLSYGATGTAYFLQRAMGEVPRPVLDWMVNHFKPSDYPPGLFSGLSGVAWAFLDFGLQAQAEAAMEAAVGSPLIYEHPDLFWGTSGWGLANLAFWHRTGADRYLKRAMDAGEHMLRTKLENAQGAYWELNGTMPLGFGHGNSGVALFLLGLHAACKEERFLDAAIKGLDFEMANCEQLEGSVLWFPRVNAPLSAPKSPHMRHGSAGVGTALLRGYRATGDERLRKFADRCANTVSERHTNKLWWEYGLAGYGEFLLDMYLFLGDERYLNNAFHLAEAILPHRMTRKNGFAFASQDLFRISCDFGAGSAGVGLFLHRLLNPSLPRLLTVDGLIPPRNAAER